VPAPDIVKSAAVKLPALDNTPPLAFSVSTVMLPVLLRLPPVIVKFGNARLPALTLPPVTVNPVVKFTASSVKLAKLVVKLAALTLTGPPKLKWLSLKFRS
jgi:hypothetical protein